ncbi:hypothetical protein BGZ65_011655, partial [Modicella reniformis]
HQIHGKAFVTLNNPTLKILDPNSSYYQRRKLLLELKDAVEGTRSAPSVSSMGPDNALTPSPASASPILNRISSGSRPSPYVNVNNSNSAISVAAPLPSEITTVRTSFEDSPQYAKFTCSPAEETPGSTFAITPMTLQPAFGQPRPSIDTIEPLDDTIPLVDCLPQPARPINSPRPRSDPDLRQLPGRLPAQVTIETMEYTHKTPNITPRQSSIAYSVSALRPNLNVPPPIVPRSSSREYSAVHGLNVPHSSRGLSPVSPPSPGGLNYYPYPNRNQELYSTTTGAKNGPSLNERRNNPSVPHIQTQSLVEANGTNGELHPYDTETESNYAGLHSDATVVG